MRSAYIFHIDAPSHFQAFLVACVSQTCILPLKSVISCFWPFHSLPHHIGYVASFASRTLCISAGQSQLHSFLLNEGGLLEFRSQQP